MLTSEIASLPGRRVLVAPLDWGMGHATRCVAVIRQLLAAGKSVTIAAHGPAYSFLHTEFPTLDIIDLPGIDIRYSGGSSQIAALAWQMPKILASILREHIALRKIIEQTQAEVVISDNRFGLWSRKCHSVYITHQLMIKAPKPIRWAEPLMHQAHLWFIRRYNRCWIPDYPDKAHNLSGDLSHKYLPPSNALFIGPLSRFSNREVQWSDVSADTQSLGLEERYDRLVIISGPEPHRTIFLESSLKTASGNTLIVCGKPDAGKNMRNIRPLASDSGAVCIANHLSTPLLHYYLTHTPHIVSRSGYSTIMDLDALGLLKRKPAQTLPPADSTPHLRHITLIPTPGQTEQEYLAELHNTSH